MNYLVFDTETTGFPSPNLSLGHPKQARVVQLAAVQFDENWNEKKTLYSLIKPNGKWKVSKGAFKVHGISTEKCQSEGRELKEVLEEFDSMAVECSCHIAHNIEFDAMMLSIEYANCPEITFSGKRISVEQFCTMEACTSICKLPFIGNKKRFGSKYKWPKLAEAYRYFFNEDFSNAHDSLSDVRATIKVFKHLLDNKYVKFNDEKAVA